MVATRKFSQFVVGGNTEAGDIVVGLRNGINYQFNAPVGGGGGGGGAVTTIITQATPTLALGNWVRINSLGEYVPALADTAQDAEVIGVVVLVNGTQYTIQQSGYIPSSAAVFSGLTTSDVYFLDTVTAGNMVLNDAINDLQVSRPVFVADSPTSGWVVPYRGLIINGLASASGGGSGSNPSVVTITQAAHGLSAGQVVYLSGSINYSPAIGTSLATSEAVGVVTSVLNANQFVLQTEGYYANSPGSFNTAPFNVDDLGNPLVAGKVYYLSTTVAGAITATPNMMPGFFSKPIYVAEQVWATTATNAGYILPQRPLASSIGVSAIAVTQSNSFSPGNWVYIQSDGTYALAQANTLASSQAVGVVLSATGSSFVIQQSGFCSGVVTTDALGNPIVSAAVYYLSPTVGGAIQNGPPVGAMQFSKPLYIQQTLAGNTGVILDQRPLPVTSGGGGTGWTLINTQSVTNAATLNITGMTGFNRYQLTLQNLTPSINANTLWMRTSSNNGASYDSAAGNYSWSSYANNVSSNYSNSDTKIQLTSNSGSDPVSSNVAFGGVSGLVQTIGSSNPAFYTQFLMQTNHVRSVDGLVIGGFGNVGARSQANIVNAIQFLFASGTISGTVTLEGTNV